MDKTERLVGLQSREGLTAYEINAVQQLVQLRQLNDEESWKDSSHGSNGSSWSIKGRSKGSNHQGCTKAMVTGKKRTKAVLDRGESLRQQKKRKYRSILQIYAETEPVDAGDV